jgi:TRAP-type C4-dicarboxylate transport system permease small subunit
MRLRSIVLVLGKVLERIEGLALALGMVLLLLLLALVSVEVAGRYLFGYSTLIADEYGGYIYTWLVMLGAVHLLRSDRLLAVTGLTDRFPSIRQGAALLSALISLFVAAVSLHAVVSIARMSWLFGTRSIQPSATPLVWPQLVLIFGFALLCVACIEETLRRLIGLPPRRSGEAAEFTDLG